MLSLFVFVLSMSMKQTFHLLVHLTFLFMLSKPRHTPTQPHAPTHTHAVLSHFTKSDLCQQGLPRSVPSVVVSPDSRYRKLDDEAFRSLKRARVTSAVKFGLFEIHNFDVQSTGQKPPWQSQVCVCVCSVVCVVCVCVFVCDVVWCVCVVYSVRRCCVVLCGGFRF